MADFHDVRARIRETSDEPQSDGGGLSFWIVTAIAVAVGFTVVMIAPRLYTVQRTAALPAFKDVRTESAQAVHVVDVAALVADPLRYADKSADEIGRIADSICAPRQPDNRVSIADQSEQLHCLLTEGLPRYCSAIQRSKITAAIISHFRVVEHAAAIGKAEVEPRVLASIEDLIRAGYILKPQRDDIGTVAPREIRERFARVVGNKLPCPDPPWWAIWK
ncbi:MAG: hypothetical protein E6G97_02770 [Alphaproteobacteria bacterium]|nr:MAG: hypothetical protein E6G97_02770 [Alphaproteobacteria bacterium]